MENELQKTLDEGAPLSAAHELPIDISRVIPTVIPELLRQASIEATRLASDRFNYLDNNPFIKREWLIVSQILHNAATAMEKRFAVLFQGR